MGWVKDNLVNWLGINVLDEVVSYVNQMLNGDAKYIDYSSDTKKLAAIFSNPAMMKVFALQCDLFSLGRIKVMKDGQPVDNDPYIDMLKRPNPFQVQGQFLWDMMFWNMVGNTYNYCENTYISSDNNLYVLESNKIEFPSEMMAAKDKLVLSKASIKKIGDFRVKYTYADGGTTYIPWGRIIHTPDLTNGTGNWFRGASRIDSLYKIISNSEASMDALNINLQFSGKFMVAGKTDMANVNQQPMSEGEKNDIETKLKSKKNVHAVKSMIDIKRFVENIGNLKLDEINLAQYFLIGSCYGIPRDVLEAFNSGTYENQEKARGAFVSYCLQPKGNLFLEGHANFFGYNAQGKSIIIDWEHLPFMQVFAKDRAETEKIRSQTLLNYMIAGVPIDEINATMGTQYSELNYDTAARFRKQ